MRLGGAAVRVLACGRVAYRGEPLALLCGPDPELLGELAASTQAEIEATSASEQGHGEPFQRRSVRVRAVRCGPLAGRLLPAALAAAHASLLAWRSGKAVRLLYEYRDLELWSFGSAEAVIKHETALTGEGS